MVRTAACISAMVRKQPEIPPEADKAFDRDLKACFKAKDLLKHVEIAAKQGWLLQQHLPRRTKLRISDLKELFLQIREQL
jgi:hypothetical protein